MQVNDIADFPVHTYNTSLTESLVGIAGVSAVIILAWVLIIRETLIQKVVRSIPAVEEDFWDSAKTFFGPTAHYVLKKSRALHREFQITSAQCVPCFFVDCDSLIQDRFSKTPTAKRIARCIKCLMNLQEGPIFSPLKDLDGAMCASVLFLRFAIQGRVTHDKAKAGGWRCVQ